MEKEMEYKGYQGRCEWDEDIGAFYGEVVSIRDVITFQGSTLEETEEAFRKSVDDYLAFCNATLIKD